MLNSKVRSDDKLKELILYASQKCCNDPKFDATKLNKILFFADFLQYARTGKSITGADYQRLPNGPAPKRLIPIRQRMIERGELVLIPISFPDGKRQDRTAALRDPNLALFTAKDIAMVDSVIGALENKNANEVTN